MADGTFTCCVCEEKRDASMLAGHTDEEDLPFCTVCVNRRAKAIKREMERRLMGDWRNG